MTAHSSDFPWPSYYGHFNFFEDRLRGHRCVDSFRNLGDGRYEVKLKNLVILQIFICECYSFGIAEYLEVYNKIYNLNIIIINSNWCGYTNEARQACFEKKLGLFKINEFMGAINREDYWNYLDELEAKQRKKGSF